MYIECFRGWKSHDYPGWYCVNYFTENDDQTLYIPSLEDTFGGTPTPEEYEHDVLPYLVEKQEVNDDPELLVAIVDTIGGSVFCVYDDGDFTPEMPVDELPPMPYHHRWDDVEEYFNFVFNNFLIDGDLSSILVL